MSTNSFVEIIGLKKKLSKRLLFDFIRGKTDIIFKKNKFQKFFIKIIHDLIEICLENFFFEICLEIIFQSVFLLKKYNKILKFFLIRIAETYVKNIFVIYLENNFKNLVKIANEKFNKQTKAFVCEFFLKLIDDSKGKVCTSLSNYFKKNKKISSKLSYEYFQHRLENTRIGVDSKNDILAKAILDLFFKNFFLAFCFPKIKFCLYEQIIRIFYFTKNFKFILPFYLNKIVEFSENRIKNLKIKKELIIAIIYLNFIKKKKLYYRVIFTLKNRFFSNCTLKRLDSIGMKNLFNLKKIDFLIKKIRLYFDKNSIDNFTKHLISNHIQSALFVSFKCCSFFNIQQYSTSSNTDPKDIEHWLHNFINSNRYEGRLDRILGIFFC